MRITPEDSADLAFIDAALMVGAISVSELRPSVYAIAELSESPLWLFDLSYFDEPAFHWTRIIGFQPCEPDVDDDALAGIALARGREIDVTTHSPAAALQVLADHPSVSDRFRGTFPFLSY